MANIGRLAEERASPKRSGEMAEAAFVVKATGLGLAVSKPWGDSERYDFVVDSGARIWRVQVKSTGKPSLGGYEVRAIYSGAKHKDHYTARDIDVLVAHIVPLNLWYVVPAEELPESAILRFYPGDERRQEGRGRFEKFREAWEWFGEVKERAGGEGVQAGVGAGAGACVIAGAADSRVDAGSAGRESVMERNLGAWAGRMQGLYFGRKG